MHNGCSVWIENSVTQDIGSASLFYPCDGIFNPHLISIKDSYTVASWESILPLLDLVQPQDAGHQGIWARHDKTNKMSVCPVKT